MQEVKSVILTKRFRMERQMTWLEEGLPGEEAAHLLAAQGWLELGDHAAALVELERLAAIHRYHPAALQVRWALYMKAEQWQAAFQLADFMTRVPPLSQEAKTFLQRSHAASRMDEGGVDLAYGLLEEVCGRFVGEPSVSYQLACYACQLGRVPEARVLLGIAFAMAEKCQQSQGWHSRALSEPALEPLWAELTA